jgi:hypothetical protein
LYLKLTKLLAVLLLAEAVRTAFWIAELLPSLGWRGHWILLLVLARAGVGALQIASTVLLFDASARGVRLAQIALISSAVLLTLEIGLRLAPSDVDPSFRWWIVGAYWVYAGAMGTGLQLWKTQALHAS